MHHHTPSFHDDNSPHVLNGNPVYGMPAANWKQFEHITKDMHDEYINAMSAFVYVQMPLSHITKDPYEECHLFERGKIDSEIQKTLQGKNIGVDIHAHTTDFVPMFVSLLKYRHHDKNTKKKIPISIFTRVRGGNKEKNYHFKTWSYHDGDEVKHCNLMVTGETQEGPTKLGQFTTFHFKRNDPIHYVKPMDVMSEKEVFDYLKNYETKPDSGIYAFNNAPPLRPEHSTSIEKFIAVLSMALSGQGPSEYSTENIKLRIRSINELAISLSKQDPRSDLCVEIRNAPINCKIEGTVGVLFGIMDYSNDLETVMSEMKIATDEYDDEDQNQDSLIGDEHEYHGRFTHGDAYTVDNEDRVLDEYEEEDALIEQEDE